MRSRDGHLLHGAVVPSPEVVRRKDGAVTGQIGVQVARLELFVRLAAVEQFLRAVFFLFENGVGRRGGGRVGRLGWSGVRGVSGFNNCLNGAAII